MNTSVFLLALSFLPFFEARNQAANFIIAPPAEGVEAKAEKPDMTGYTICPACVGKRELLLEEPDFGQHDGRLLGGSKKKRKKCPLCKGEGRFASFMDPADIALQIARDHETFVAEHRGKGELSVGEAFVPHDAYESLDRNKKKMIEEAFGKACTKCNWSGIEACKKCSGRGVLPCPEDDCKNGFLVTKTTTEKTRRRSGGLSGNNGYNRNSGFRSSSGSRTKTIKETKTTVLVCPTCEGAKFVLCPECNGRKAHPCKKCNGLGIKKKGGGF
ncbi:MAG: hypothetical protein ACI4QF_06245 [Kiritimatiellia bacterium]